MLGRVAQVMRQAVERGITRRKETGRTWKIAGIRLDCERLRGGSSAAEADKKQQRRQSLEHTAGATLAEISEQRRTAGRERFFRSDLPPEEASTMTSHAEIELRIELVNQRKREAIVQWAVRKSQIFLRRKENVTMRSPVCWGQKPAVGREAAGDWSNKSNVKSPGAGATLS